MAVWARAARARYGRVGASAAAAAALASALIGGQAEAAPAPSHTTAPPHTTAPSHAPAAAPYYFAPFGMSDVWKVTSGGQVVVAVVAGGVGSPAGMLQNALMPGGDVSSDGGKGGTGDVLTSYDGTQVAALIAAKSTSPIEGMAPGASILPVRDIAKGEQNSDAAETARGIKYAADHGATVILVVDTSPKLDHTVAAAVAYAQGKNAIVVAPSGNTGQSGNTINAMCAFDGVVCVAAITKEGAHWPNSASGARVDLAAPGSQVTVPMPSGTTRLGSSTHYSAALVAAEAALLRSAHPTWTAGQVVRVMIQTTAKGKADHGRVGDATGYGVINPLSAVKALEPSSTANPLASASTPASGGSGAPNASHQPAKSAASSGGSGSGAILLIIGAAVGGLVLVGLVGWLVMRGRTSRAGNYLTDPAYGAGYYYEQDSGPTSQLGGYQGWNAQQPQRQQSQPYSPGPMPPQPAPPYAAPQPFQQEPTPPPYRPSQPMRELPAPQQPFQPQPPVSEPEPEFGSGGYTLPFIGGLPVEPPQDLQPPQDPESSGHDS